MVLQESEELLALKQQTVTKTILLVDDDEDTREFLAEALSSIFLCDFYQASEASQALSIAKEVKPDVFVLDYRLPNMTGLALYDQLHTIAGLEATPTLLLTASSTRALDAQIEMRQIEVLEKPFDLDELEMIFQQILDRL